MGVSSLSLVPLSEAMKIIDIFIVLFAIGVLIGAVRALVKDPLMLLFYEIGKRYKYKTKHLNGHAYYFSAKPDLKEKAMYSGGVLFILKQGLVLKHPLISRWILKTALMPWSDIKIGKDVSPYSILLEIDDDLNIQLYCRPKAIKEIKEKLHGEMISNASNLI